MMELSGEKASDKELEELLGQWFSRSVRYDEHFEGFKYSFITALILALDGRNFDKAIKLFIGSELLQDAAREMRNETLDDDSRDMYSRLVIAYLNTEENNNN